MVQNVLDLDPVHWAEKHLTLDGEPFRLHGNGYKPFADIYRYVGVKALEKDSKPIVFVKGRQVGGTTMAAVLELYFLASGFFGKNNPPIRIMHCFPILEHAYKYSKTKFNTMILSSKGEITSTPGKKTKSKSYIESKLDSFTNSNDSLQFKQFEGGNHIFIESTGFTADRLRGITADVVMYDEVQDMRAAALSNSAKSLTKAQYGREGDGVRVYFGTPKQRGSEYWKIWNSSNQQYYHLGCAKCGEYFPLYTPGSNEWESIWIEDDLPDDHPSHGFIVKCVHCSHEQDKRKAAEIGKWVPLNDDPNCKFIGYHLNQLYMPNFNRAKVVGEKPENHPVNTERAYQNEVLGEFFAGDASPITPEQIEKLCADFDRGFRGGIVANEQRRVYLGCDWGLKVDIDQLSGSEKDEKKSQGQSYSCAVILMAEGPHILSVEFATRLKRNDFEYKKQVVEQLMRQYNVKLAVGDIGYAGDLTEVLQKEYGGRFLASESLGKIQGHYKFKEDFPARIGFEKDYLIAEAYDLMKKGLIRFPYRNYEQIMWLIHHCSSMELKPSVSRSGDVTIKYVKGSTPNDGFMALNNALLAYKFDITNGFKLTNPNDFNKEPGQSKQIPAIVSYMPGLEAIKRK